LQRTRTSFYLHLLLFNFFSPSTRVAGLLKYFFFQIDQLAWLNYGE